MRATATSAVSCPILIGRADALSALRGLLDTTRDGRGQMALIAGEAGVGKSRLMAEVRAYGGASGFLTLEGHCFEHDAARPYAPWIDLLRAQSLRAAPPARAADLDPALRELIQLLPGVIPAPLDLEPLPALDPESRRRRLFAAFAHYVTAHARLQPVALILEDLHWSDEDSLDLLHHLARYTVAAPVALLATYRNDEDSPRPGHWLARMVRERLTHELTLERLARDEVAQMLGAIFGLDQAPRPEFLDAICELTDGNPFFIEEALKALIAGGDIFYGASGWDRKPLGQLRIPGSMRDAVRQRVERLSPLARRLVILAAVAGRRFDIPLLQDLARLHEDVTLQAVKELIAAQLVVEETADRLAFRHALTQQAIIADLLARERRPLHEAIAGIIERRHDAERARYADDLAYHYFEAQVWDKALTYARLAASQAETLYAPQAAVQSYTRALTAADRLALDASDLRRARGAAYETLGEIEAARADYEGALQIARVAGDPRAEWAAALALGALYAGLDYGQAGAYFSQALDLARALGDQELIARSLNRAGNWRLNSDAPEGALGLHHDAFAIFESLGDQRGLAETLDLLGMTYNIAGDTRRSTESYARAITMFRALDDRQGLVNALIIHALQSGSYWHETLVPSGLSAGEAQRAGDEALRMARAMGWQAGESYALFEMALWLGPRGEYVPALAMARAALEQATAIEHRQWITGAHATLGALALDMLDLAVARAHLEQAIEQAQALGSRLWLTILRAVLSDTLRQQGDLPGAAAALAAAGEPGRAMRGLGERMLWRARADLALVSGDASGALATVERLIAADPNASGADVAPRLSQMRGEALAALGKLDEAEAALLAARAAAIQAGARPLLWRIHLSRARLLALGKRRAEAELEAAAARTLIAELAAGLPENDTRAAFISAAARMAPPPQSRTTLQTAMLASGGLTRREREVARLIAGGRSNSEIADLLVISKRTVETHIGSILSKLGVASRAQIVVWAIAQGLTEDAL